MKEILLENYSLLLDKYREIIILSSAASVLSWDMMTMMPPGGISLRSEQLALLTGIHHRMVVDPYIGRLLDDIEQDPDYSKMSPVEKRNIQIYYCKKFIYKTTS